MNNDEIILISDIHYGVHGNSLEWIENINSYFDKFFIPLVQKEISDGKNPIIFVLGDYFQDRVRLTLDIIHYGQIVMRKLSSLCPVHMLVGNHDNYEKVNTDINSLHIFKDMNNVTIYDEFTTIDVNGVTIDVMPWFGETKECMLAANKKIKSSKSDLIFMHSDINGCSMDNGFPITTGINSTTFKGNKIYSGHIHKRQNGKKVTYIGSPYHTSKSDIENIKGVYILGCDNHTVTERFVENTYSPKCVKINVDDLYSSDQEDLKQLIDNNYLFIVGEPDKNNIKLREYLHNFNMRRYEYVNKQVSVIVDSSVSESELPMSYKDTGSIISMIETAIDSLADVSDEEKDYLKSINKSNFE